MIQEHISILNEQKYNAERWTSSVLRVGVWASASLMIAGLIFALIFPSSIVQISANPSLGSLFLNLLSGSFDPVTLMFAGLVLLMFTPVLRVFTAVIGFAAEHDWRFVIISLVVLLMLAGEIIYSMIF